MPVLFLDDELATTGPITRQFEKIESTHLEHGVHIAQEIARLDIGQGVVVRKGTVIAVEAFEGPTPCSGGLASLKPINWYLSKP